MTVAFLLPTPVFLLDFLLFFFFHPLDLIPLDFSKINLFFAFFLAPARIVKILMAIMLPAEAPELLFN